MNFLPTTTPAGAKRAHEGRGLLLLAAFLLAGCVSPHQPPSESTSLAEEAAVKSRLAEVFEAAEAKDFPRLDSYHAYDRHFTKFGPGPTARMEAAAAREGEHTGLRAVAGLKLRAEDVQVDVFGDTAVATMLITASFQSGVERVTKQDRATLVFIKAGGSWKIVHEHISAGP